MSWWDLFIILFIAFALFRGYQRGFTMRLTGWVGGVLVFLIIWFRFDALKNWVYKFVDGEHMVSGWIQAYLKANRGDGDTFANSQIMDVINALPLTPSMTYNLTTQLEQVGGNIQQTIYEQVAQIIAAPVWHLLLFVITWIFLQIFFGFVGQLFNALFIRVPILNMIDKYLGALVSAVFSLVLVTLFSVVLMAVFNDNTTLGLALKESYFAPALRTAMLLFFRNGDVL